MASVARIGRARNAKSGKSTVDRMMKEGRGRTQISVECCENGSLFFRCLQNGDNSSGLPFFVPPMPPSRILKRIGRRLRSNHSLRIDRFLQCRAQQRMNREGLIVEDDTNEDSATSGTERQSGEVVEVAFLCVVEKKRV